MSNHFLPFSLKFFLLPIQQLLNKLKISLNDIHNPIIFASSNSRLTRLSLPHPDSRIRHNFDAEETDDKTNFRSLLLSHILIPLQNIILFIFCYCQTSYKLQNGTIPFKCHMRVILLLLTTNYRLDMCRRQHANDACNRGTAGNHFLNSLDSLVFVLLFFFLFLL